MAGVSTIANTSVIHAFLDPVPTVLPTEVAEPRSTSPAPSVPADPFLPFQRLTLETMGLGKPLNSADIAALITDVSLQLDAVMDKIREARIKGASTRADIAFAQIFNQSSIIQALASQITALVTGIATSQTELAELNVSLATTQALNNVFGPLIKKAAGELRAAEDVIASLIPDDPEYKSLFAAAVAVRDAQTATLSDLNQQKLVIDVQISDLHQAIGALTQAITAQLGDLETAKNDHDSSLEWFIAIYSSISSSGAENRARMKSNDYAERSLGEMTAANLKQIDANFNQKLERLAVSKALVGDLQVETIVSDRVRQASMIFATGLADILSSLVDLHETGHRQFGADFQRTTA